MHGIDVAARAILQDTIAHFQDDFVNMGPGAWDPQMLSPDSADFNEEVRNFVESQCTAYLPPSIFTYEQYSWMILNRIAYIIYLEAHNE